jgi:ribonuclease D
LEKVAEAKVIGIDTESRVARTTLDTNFDVLATIQIAAGKEVFIFDALALKKGTIELPQIQLFFKNKEVSIVGHTL